MSRIGNSPISVPEGVDIDIKPSLVTVKGKLGELTQRYSDCLLYTSDAADE